MHVPGVAPVRYWLECGVNVGLGVDGTASNDSGHMLAEARLALFLQRGVAKDAGGECVALAASIVPARYFMIFVHADDMCTNLCMWRRSAAMNELSLQCMRGCFCSCSSHTSGRRVTCHHSWWSAVQLSLTSCSAEAGMKYVVHECMHSSAAQVMSTCLGLNGLMMCCSHGRAQSDGAGH